MLFNSVEFLFAFLPLTLLGFFLAARMGQRLALAWLTLASLFFYAWWNPLWLPLLLGSIAFNLWVGRRLSLAAAQGEGGAPAAWPSRRVLMVLAVAANLLLLGYYKYADFALANVAALLGTLNRPGIRGGCLV